MTQLQTIKTEIERRKSAVEGWANQGFTGAKKVLEELVSLLSFIENMEDDYEADLDFAKQLETLKEKEKKLKLPELIDWWWMQEDMEGNRMIAKAKEHFASAMRKAYNVGLSQSELPQESKISTPEQIYQRGKHDGYGECLANVANQLNEINARNASPMVLVKDFADAPKIKGWAVRNEDGSLVFISVKPIRSEEYKMWYVPGACITCYFGFNKSFPNLKWEDEPIEVELILNRL